jgi:hypothetical protein
LAKLPEYAHKSGPDEWRIQVWVQPGARKNESVGLYQGRLKVRLAAPAVENKANKALVKYLAGLLGVKPGRLAITAGQTSRRKTLCLASDSEPDWAGLNPAAGEDTNT